MVYLPIHENLFKKSTKFMEKGKYTIHRPVGIRHWNTV